ncbi:MAG: hypothetical protein NT000_12425 [Proteobacteria bacterium]|nr:hypothetical protein [Pseudomonadota bacterium]
MPSSPSLFLDDYSQKRQLVSKIQAQKQKWALWYHCHLSTPIVDSGPVPRQATLIFALKIVYSH